jgi:acyl carrier protein
MNREEIKKIIEDSIRTETEFEGNIEEMMAANDIEGWDSLAHVRIIFRIDHHLGTQVDLNATYATNTITELIELFVEEVK